MRMRGKTILGVGLVAAAHFLLLFLAVTVCFSHSLRGMLGPVPDTCLSRAASRAASVLGQPLWLLLEAMPKVAAHPPFFWEQALGWVLYGLNSVLWALAICWIFRLSGRAIRKLSAAGS